MAEGLRIPTTQTVADIVPGLGNLPALPQGDLPEGLLPYLSELGLSGTHLAKVMSLVQATDVDEPAVLVPPGSQDAQLAPASHESTPPPTKLVKLWVAEEQLILKNAYQSFFTNESSIDLLGATNDTSMDALVGAVEEHQPQVLLVGVKALRAEVVEKLRMVKDAGPEVAIVLLFAFYDAQGIKALRGYSQGSSLGRAYLLKHTIDTIDQLIQVVCSVAQVLSRDVRTVERHINSIYGKLDIDDGSRDPRVNAALKYLQATGSLPKEADYED